MSRIFQDSCQLYSSAAEVKLRWTVTGGSQGVAATQGRRGGRALSFGYSSDYARKVFDDLEPELYVGFACRFTGISPATSPAFFYLLDNNNAIQVDLRIDGNGAVLLTRNGTELGRTANAAVVAGSVHHFQVHAKIAHAGGQAELRMDGRSVASISFTGDTQATTSAGAKAIQFSGPASGQLYLCDVVVNNATGTRNNAWPGDVRVDVIVPTGSGANNGWAPSTGTERYACVNAVPVQTAKFIESSTPGDLCTMKFPAFPGGQVQAVQSVLYGQKTDAGARSMAPVFRDGGADRDGATVALFDSLGFFTQMYETDPSTGAEWTAGKVAEFGPKLVS